MSIPGGEPVSAVILCGGAGQRVGGADKPLLSLGDRPLIEWVLQRIRPQVDHVLISANRNLDRYADYGEVLRDREPHHAGPLAGIRAALAVCPTPWLLACAGDAPFLPHDLVQRLAERLRQSDPAQTPAGAAVAIDGQLEPLPALVHRSTAAALDAYLAAGRRSVHGWLAELALVPVDFTSSVGAFASLNTPEDFAAAQSCICDCR
jgi:molybdenum cofactor guanylyltransferase